MRTVKTAFFTVLFFRGGGDEKKDLSPPQPKKRAKEPNTQTVCFFALFSRLCERFFYHLFRRIFL